MNTYFHLIMELCNDTALLGLKLLQAAQSLLARYVNSHDEKRNGNFLFFFYRDIVNLFFECIQFTLIIVYYLTVSTLKTIVELLIRSHDCFTASCNMEGIASVLRKCQNLANILQMLKHWTLLVC